MSEHARDTHFAGFAQLLYQELSNLDGGYETVISEYRNKYDKQEIVQLIARRAYDLVVYAAKSTIDTVFPDLVANEIPDIATWDEMKQAETLSQFIHDKWED